MGTIVFTFAVIYFMAIINCDNAQNLYPTIPPYMMQNAGLNPQNWHAPGNQRQTLTFGKCLVDVVAPTSVVSGGGYQPVPSIQSGAKPNIITVETCCNGFEQDQRDLNSCVAICENGCPNGRCVSANQCECNSGFVLDTISGTCAPSCVDFRCRCNPGYGLDPSNKFCVPQCPHSCGKNGLCSAPGICSCAKGYALSSSNICEAVCTPPCGNGKCTTPGQCSCFNGFILKNATCQANCPKGCENGRCVSNDVCACDSGWSLSNDRSRCDPQCNINCNNGVCARPNMCACLPGYHWVGRDCKPLCKLGCIQGDCVAPEVCVCRPGYTLDPSGRECKMMVQLCPNGFNRDPQGICKPVCRSGCPNGVCTSPEICACNPGYVFLQGTCRQGELVYIKNTTAVQSSNNPSISGAQCSIPCLNGYCSGYNMCTCNPGYVNTANDLSHCYAHCPNGCPNGQCISPNFCTCNLGYVKRNGACVRG